MGSGADPAGEGGGVESAERAAGERQRTGGPGILGRESAERSVPGSVSGPGTPRRGEERSGSPL
ncbi:hypothetical protein ABZ715_33200, partial [Streptomyces sp. NPDC006785]